MRLKSLGSECYKNPEQGKKCARNVKNLNQNVKMWKRGCRAYEKIKKYLARNVTRMSWQPHFFTYSCTLLTNFSISNTCLRIHNFHMSIRNFHMLIHIFCTVVFVVTFFVTYCCRCFHDLNCSWIVNGPKNRHLILGLVWQASRADPIRFLVLLPISPPRIPEP